MPITPPVCKICGAAHWFADPHAGMLSKPTARTIAKIIEAKANKPAKPKGKRK